MDLRGILKLKLICLLLILSTGSVNPSFAVTGAFAPMDPKPGYVQIEYPAEFILPYRERRPRHQLTFNVNYENYAPVAYLSPAIADPNLVSNTYSNVYDLVDIPLVSASLGWKVNVPFLGIEIAPFYGVGSVQSKKSGESMSLSLEKYGVRVAAALETIFPEPYVVPYLATQLQMWGIEEVGSTLTYSRTTGYAVGFQAGLLLQLNWLDSAAAARALRESGLQNTYVDLFVQQYGDTSDPEDPLMNSEFNWGAGLRLEY